MKARIASYRRSRRTQYGNQMIVESADVTSKEAAEKLVGKKVTWTIDGKNKTTIAGEVRAAHGGKGALRVLFERGMPGQALGSEVTIN